MSASVIFSPCHVQQNVECGSTQQASEKIVGNVFLKNQYAKNFVDEVASLIRARNPNSWRCDWDCNDGRVSEELSRE